MYAESHFLEEAGITYLQSFPGINNPSVSVKADGILLTSQSNERVEWLSKAPHSLSATYKITREIDLKKNRNFNGTFYLDYSKIK